MIKPLVHEEILYFSSIHVNSGIKQKCYWQNAAACTILNSYDLNQ